MSYAAMGMGAASGQTTTCDGQLTYQVGGDVRCCWPKSWSNATYKAVIGATSLQYKNEQRVRYALGLLLNPTAAGDVTGIEAFAYAHGEIPIAAGLVDRLFLALKAYNTVAPARRWSQKAKGALAPAPCGLFPTWVASGIPLNAALRATINSVPGSTPARNVETMPTLDELLRVSGGQVEPHGWTIGFLDAFLPKAGLKLPGGGLFTGQKVTIIPSGGGRSVAVRDTSAPDDSAGGMSRNTKIALGVTALAVVGFGVWGLRKRR